MVSSEPAKVGDIVVYTGPEAEWAPDIWRQRRSNGWRYIVVGVGADGDCEMRDLDRERGDSFFAPPSALRVVRRASYEQVTA